MRTLTRPLPLRFRIHLAARVVWTYVVVRVVLRREALPAVVARLRVCRHPAAYRLAPKDLGRIVRRVLGLGGHPPRCLFNALVLYRLLWTQTDAVELVIGLPVEPAGKDAHAWVELDREDVGPPPGACGHLELARYGGPGWQPASHLGPRNRREPRPWEGSPHSSPITER